VVLVEATPGRAAQIQTVPITAGRPLRTLEGTVEELERRAEQVERGLLRLVVHTPQATPGLPEWAARVFPRATLLDVSERCLASKLEMVGEAPTGETFEDLEQAFRTYLADHAPDDLNGDDLLTLFGELAQGDEAPERAELKELVEVLA
jgi:exonuclease SbcD